jgi:hypothetical protein
MEGNMLVPYRLASVPYLTYIFVAFALSTGLSQSGSSSLVCAADDGAVGHSDEIPSSGDWKAVGTAEKADVLQLLVLHMAGNYDKIRTWSGSYTQHFDAEYGPEMLAKAKAKKNVQEKMQAVFESVCTFDIDFASNECRLAVEEGKQRYYDPKSNRPIESPLARVLVERCIVTPEHYIRFEPDEHYRDLIPLIKHNLPPKRAAFRGAPRESQLSLFSDFVDPRFFFCIAGRVKIWEEYTGSFIPAFQGKLGSETKDAFNRMLDISKAVRGGEVWYRVKFQSPEKGYRIKEYTHASSAGFNVIGAVTWQGDSPSHLYSWRYKQIDGIYVPSKVTLQYHNLQKKRVLELRDCVLNKPIPSSQFSYLALGLCDDDLIMDNIEKVAYKFKSGERMRLAGYGEPPVRAESSKALGKAWQLTILISLLVLLMAIFARRQYRKRRQRA